MTITHRKSVSMLCVLALLCSIWLPAWPGTARAAENPKPHSGDWMLEVTLGNTGKGMKSGDLTVGTNTDYTAKLWLRGTGEIGIKVMGLGDWATIEYLVHTGTPDWTEVSIPFNSGDRTGVTLQLMDISAGGKMYVDDFSVTSAAGADVAHFNSGFESGPGVSWWAEDAVKNSFNIIQSKKAPAVTPGIAQYNLAAGEDLVFQTEPSGETLQAILNGDEMLASETDYTAASDVVTIADSYLANLAEGDYTLQFDYSGTAADPTVALKVVNAAVQGVTERFVNYDLMHERARNDDGTDRLHLISEPSNTTLGPNRLYAEPADRDDNSFVYKLDVPIHSFVATAVRWTLTHSDPPKVEVSADGTQYVQVPVEYTGKLVLSDWEEVTYTAFEMPIEDARYLKVTMPNIAVLDGRRVDWAFQMQKLWINSKLAPVSATPEPSKLSDPVDVALTSEQDGAEIYYYTDKDSTIRLYTGPIPVAETVKIYAFARKAGFDDSPVRELVYYSAMDEKVDPYGQLKASDFPRKIKSDEQLRADVAEDEAYYGSLTPPERDIYGGEPGSKERLGLTETGYYHIEKQDGKFVMVNPLGNLYFSLGVNLTGSVGESYTQVSGREYIYEWLPENTPESGFSSAYMNSGNDYFSYYIANLIRKYEKPFNKADYYRMSVERLKKWGFTSEGGFSDTPSAESNDTGFPEVKFSYLPDGFSISGTSLYDIFKEGADDALAQLMTANRIAERKDDPRIVGYFFGNELPYHQFDRHVLTAKASEVATKGALVDWLSERYEGDIAAFNAGWETTFESFEAMREVEIPRNTETSATDMNAFFEVYLDLFYSTLEAKFREADPNHMLMGDRYLVNVGDNSTIRNSLAKVAGKYLDVISYNYYTYSPDISRIRSMAELADKPIMITEFHYGEPTAGLNSAIRMVENEDEKGKSYRNYVEQLAASGYVVGTHWFQYMDQAVTGRWFQGYDGEAYAIGMLNGQDRPYKTMLESVMAANYDIYDVITGEKEPFVFNKYGNSEEKPTKSATVRKTGEPIVVDGVKDAHWPEGETLHMDDADRVLGASKDGIEADMNLAWDDDHLYVYAKIKDDTPMMNPKTGFDIWNGDALELFVGPTRINDPGGLKPTDSQIVISATGESYWYHNNSTTQPAIETAVKLDEDGLGYTIEAAIAMDDLKIDDLENDRLIRFDIGFDNGEGNNRIAQYLWSGVDGNASNRDKWGTATLSDGEVEPGPGTDPGAGGIGGGLVVDRSGTATLKTKPVLGAGGKASVSIGQHELDGEMSEASPNGKGLAIVDIVLEEVGGATTYGVTLPVGAFASSNGNGDGGKAVRLVTPLGSVLITDDMLNPSRLQGQKTIEWTIGEGSASDASDRVVQARIGDRPVVVLDALGAEEGGWSNTNSPLNVSIPYDPGKEEHRFITVYAIDEAGNAELVPNAKYDETSGRVFFTATGSGTYAIAYSTANMDGLPSWLREAAETVVSKSLLASGEESGFEPGKPVSRGEFLAGLVRALGLSAVGSHAYLDVEGTSLYEEEIAIASELGIVRGFGDGTFKPDAPISRQDMMVMIDRALDAMTDSRSPLGNELPNGFEDGGEVSSYARGSISRLIEEQWIVGNGDGALTPKRDASRGEAAVVLHRLWSRLTR